MSEQVPGSFKAFRIRNDDDGYQAGIESISLEDLSEGDVVIKVHFSGINFKDALAGTGKGNPVMKSWSPAAACLKPAMVVIQNTCAWTAPGWYHCPPA